MQRYQQNYFSWILIFKDAKSWHVFFIIIIYANINFFIFERLGHMQFKIKLYF